MTTASVTYEFTAATSAAASQVNTNFDDLLNFLNTEVIKRDGSVAMTAALTLSGDPVNANHAARKSYVDAVVGNAATPSDWTPTLTQNGAVAKTVSYAKYVQIGKLVIAEAVLGITGTGTSIYSVTSTLPVSRAYTTNEMILGTFKYVDAGPASIYRGNVQGFAGQQFVTFFDGSLGGAVGTNEGTMTPFAANSGDTLAFSVVYFAA